MKIRKNQVLVFIMIVFTCIFATGCWNNRDLTDVSIVIAIGIDKTEDNKIELTVQIVNASVMQRQNGGSAEKAYWVFSSTGETVFEALRNQLTTVDGKLFNSHVQLLVLGESLAKEGIQSGLDFFERDHELNLQANVIITKGISAKEVLQAESELESLPAMHLVDIIKNNTALAKMKEVSLFELLREMGSQGREPVVSVVSPKIQDSKEQLLIKDLQIEGVAVLKGDKLVGELNSIETRGLLFITNKVSSTIINIPNPLHEDKKVAIEVTQSNATMDVELKDGQLTLLVDVNEEGNIGGQQDSGDLTTREMVSRLEEETKKVIDKEIRDVIKVAQKEYEADIFGFGDIVHRKYLDYWKQVKEHWNEEFSQAAVEVNVKSNIRRSGMIKEATESK